MSMEVATAEKSLGQFASNNGYTELMQYVTKAYPNVTEFFKTGITDEVSDVCKELKAISLKAPSPIAKTAEDLYRRIVGHTVVMITDGAAND